MGILIANLLCLLEDRETHAKLNVAWILPARSINLIAARYIIPRHISTLIMHFNLVLKSSALTILPFSAKKHTLYLLVF